VVLNCSNFELFCAIQFLFLNIKSQDMKIAEYFLNLWARVKFADVVSEACVVEIDVIGQKHAAIDKVRLKLAPV
jgi:hypothetical protein